MSTANEAQHTPTPWDYTGEEDGDFVIWGSHPDTFVANLGEPFAPVLDNPKERIAFDVEKANAAFIVQAVNAHKALVEALTAIASSDEDVLFEYCVTHQIAAQRDDSVSYKRRKIAEAALKLAGKKEG